MDILDNVYTILDKTKGLLEIASVPGLSAAADVVLAIIDQVKVSMCTPRLGYADCKHSGPIVAENASQQEDRRSTLEEDRATQQDRHERSPEGRAPSRVSWDGENGTVGGRAGNGWMAESSHSTPRVSNFAESPSST